MLGHGFRVQGPGFRAQGFTGPSPNAQPYLQPHVDVIDRALAVHEAVKAVLDQHLELHRALLARGAAGAGLRVDQVEQGQGLGFVGMREVGA